MKQSLKKKISFAFIIAIIVFCINFFASIYTFEVLIGRLANYSSSLSELNEFRYEFGEYNSYVKEYLTSGSSDSLEKYRESDKNLAIICENVNNQYASSDDNVQSSLAMSIYSNYTKYCQQIRDLVASDDREASLELYNEKYSKNAGYIESYIEKLISYRYNTSAESLEDTNSKVTIFEILHISAFIIMAVTLSILGVIIFKKVIAPIERLTRQTKQIANCNFDIEIDKLNTNDEIAELADTFRIMKDNLKNTFESNAKNIQTAESLLNQHQLNVNDDIFREANIDRLTNTMNKNAFLRCVEEDILKHELNMSCVLFILDFNNFSEITKNLYEGADEFLKISAQKLNTIFQSCNGYISRLERDIFAGFSANINNLKTVNDVCEQIIAELNTNFRYKSEIYPMTVNIGVYFCPNPESAENMIKKASEELLKVKSDENKKYSITAE